MPSRPRVAAVSFLNAKPLLLGLDDHVDLYLDVPSRLISGLTSGDFDVALLPVADIPGLTGASIVRWQGASAGGTPADAGAGIACEGETLTVRIFSDRPLDRVSVLYCDTDSHTSVRLARVILAERFGVRPELRPLPRGVVPDEAHACLLIGDKVISDPPTAGRFPHQHDLGREWNELTGRPFVFATWTARPGFDAGEVAPLLRDALASGLASVSELARLHAPKHRWPVDVAERYFTSHLRYALGPREFAAIEEFWRRAGLTSERV